MGEVIEAYSIFYPLGGRGYIRLKVRPTNGRARAAPRCKPHPHRHRPRDKLKNRSRSPERGFCHTQKVIQGGNTP